MGSFPKTESNSALPLFIEGVPEGGGSFLQLKMKESVSLVWLEFKISKDFINLKSFIFLRKNKTFLFWSNTKPYLMYL